MNMEPGAQIGSQFAFVKCASGELVCIPSTNGVVSRKFQGSVMIRVRPSFFIMKNNGK